MARPIKQGLDYFPLDVKIDEKLSVFEAEHGFIAFAFIIRLFQNIYSNGYYINWDKTNKLLFQKNTGIDMETLDIYIASCFEYEIFSEKLYEQYGILTSKGIQKRYFFIRDRKSKIEIIKEFILIDLNEIIKKFQQPTLKEFGNGETIVLTRRN